MRAEHINITIPGSLKIRLDEESKRERIGRSTIIQKAISLYLELIKKKRIKTLLVEGYKEMTGEALKITREFDALDDEAIKYVD